MAIILPGLESKEGAETLQGQFGIIGKPLLFNDNEIQLDAGIGISFYPDHASNKKVIDNICR